MFINALKIVVGPVVFFSIVTCVSQFTNLSELGKIGARVMGLYLLTTILAVCTGFGVFNLINPGVWGSALIGNTMQVEVAMSTDVVAETGTESMMSMFGMAGTIVLALLYVMRYPFF